MASDEASVAELIPQRGPVLLLDRIVEHDGERTVAHVATLARGRWLASDDGSVPGWLAIEYMAQCVAVHESLVARATGRDFLGGMLVAATGVVIERDAFHPDDDLHVETRRVRGRPGLGVLSHGCEVHSGGRLAASGRLSVSVARDDPGESG